MYRHYPRVLYIDIDIHHGDGVEQAFYSSNRVFTTSFHKYNGSFFPGTGKWTDCGEGHGKHFCLNVPLADGIDDESYLTIFREIMDAIITSFCPSVIVLQCGADSLGCDKIGAFNLSIAAHGDCVRFIKNFNLPLLVLGGGGYTIHNVSRCWTYETAVLVGASIPNELPGGPFLCYFHPDYLLHPQIVQKVENENSPAALRAMISGARQKLRYLQGAPSVCMEELPPNLQEWLDEEAKKMEMEEKVEAERDRQRDMDTRAVDRHSASNEYFDGDKDNRGERNGSGKEEEDWDIYGAGRSGPNLRRGGPRRGAGRKPRGRGAKSIRGAFQEGNESEEAAAKKSRGGGTRGRGRGRGRRTHSSESEPMSE